MEKPGLNTKLNINIPKYHLTMDEIKPSKTPALSFLKTQPARLNYEDTMFAEMADDIKSSYEKQLNEISFALNEQLSMARAEAEAAKKEAFVSKVIAIASLIVSVIIGIVPIFL